MRRRQTRPTREALATLLAVGPKLYGSRWKAPIARDLGVSRQTVMRWVAGTNTPPQSLTAALKRLTHERADDLDAMARGKPAAARRMQVVCHAVVEAGFVIGCPADQPGAVALYAYADELDAAAAADPAVAASSVTPSGLSSDDAGG